MKMPKLPFQMYRRQFIGLGIFGVVILVFQLGAYYLKNEKKENPVLVEFVDKSTENSVKLKAFNPNDLSAEEWQKLGFSERQVKTILNYKDLVGGEFLSKEQLAKCYAISPEKYVELKPYILLPERSEQKFNHQKFSKSEKKELQIFGKFNPDHYSVKDWEKMGFSVKQSEAILKYKNYLGGSFLSKEKFRQCFIISDENYKKLEPYLLLPEKSSETKPEKTEKKAKASLTYFDPNALDLEGWKNLGFSEKQAQVILNYKERNLKGNFRTLEDIQRCFVISEEKFEELKPWVKINVSESQKAEEKPSLSGKIQVTDFTKVDLNTINFRQLVEFGFEEKAARSFLGFRKKLGGFVEKKQILEVYHIDPDLAKKLVETSSLDNSEIQKYTLKNAPEEFLKTHPYFSKHSGKILYFRITYPEDKEIFKKIKATPEEIAKMKLYLK